MELIGISLTVLELEVLTQQPISSLLTQQPLAYLVYLEPQYLNQLLHLAVEAEVEVEVEAEVAVVARAVSAQPQEEAAEMVICGLALAPVVAAAAVGGEVLVVGVQSLACTPSGGNGTRRCSYNSRSHSTTILVFCCSRSAA